MVFERSIFYYYNFTKLINANFMITIISPHIDDAFLSLGGTILKWINNNTPVRIEYVFSISNWTNPNNILGQQYKNNLKDVTKIRKNEELEICKIANHSYTFLDFKYDINIELSKQKVNKQNIINNLKNQISIGSIVFFPLGISHPQHLLVREIGLEFLKAQEYDVKFYEDLPYMAERTSYTEIIDQISQFNFHPIISEIDINKKIEILKLYSSQVSHHWLNVISMYSYSCKESKHYERYWEFNKIK